MCCTVFSLLATTHYEDLYSYREVTVPAESYFTVVPGSSRSKIIHLLFSLPSNIAFNASSRWDLPGVQRYMRASTSHMCVQRSEWSGFPAREPELNRCESLNKKTNLIEAGFVQSTTISCVLQSDGFHKSLACSYHSSYNLDLFDFCAFKSVSASLGPWCFSVCKSFRLESKSIEGAGYPRVCEKQSRPSRRSRAYARWKWDIQEEAQILHQHDRLRWSVYCLESLPSQISLCRRRRRATHGDDSCTRGHSISKTSQDGLYYHHIHYIAPH
jgi:hypothetical protein